jgi:creatinine amidohydrolase
LKEQLPGFRARHPRTRIVAYTDLEAGAAEAAKMAASFDVTSHEMGMHAGEWETSVMLQIEPESVHHDRGEIGFIGDHGAVVDRINAEGIHAVAPTGVLGDPTRASAERGRLYLERIVDMLVDYVQSHEG